MRVQINDIGARCIKPLVLIVAARGLGSCTRRGNRIGVQAHATFDTFVSLPS